MAQSFAAWRFTRTGGPVLTEAEPLDPDPPVSIRPNQEANLYLEQAVTTIEWGEGLVLRYGSFYGPGTAISLAPDAQMAALVRKRRFPILGDGAGVWSHVHIDDAAAATIVAVDHGQPGIYNIVDDEPAPVREWLPVLASALDAKPPRHIPRWLGRLAAGDGDCHDDRRAGRLEREGQDAGVSPGSRALRVAAGFHRGARLSDDPQEFDEPRPAAFAIAYRMLGSVSEAEELVVQEGFLRLHRVREGGERIESPARLPVDGGLAALARPPPLRARVPSARPTWANGCRSRS